MAPYNIYSFLYTYLPSSWNDYALCVEFTLKLLRNFYGENYHFF